MPVDLDALDRLRAAATPGEWPAPCRDVHDDGTHVAAIIGAPEGPDLVISVLSDYDAKNRSEGAVHSLEQAERDATLIVALVNSYPDLAREVRAAREVVAAGRAFRAKERALQGAVDGAFQFMAIHGVAYEGETWEQEGLDLDAKLAAYEEATR